MLNKLYNIYRKWENKKTISSYEKGFLKTISDSMQTQIPNYKDLEDRNLSNFDREFVLGFENIPYGLGALDASDLLGDLYKAYALENRLKEKIRELEDILNYKRV